MVGPCVSQVVTEEQVRHLSKKLALPYFLVSAKDGLHVNEVCCRLAGCCVAYLIAN